MGNSIYGQTPSTVFAVIRDNILNESHEYYTFNTQKYDLLKELVLLAEKEKEYYENIINYYKSKKSNDGTQLEHITKFNKSIDEFTKELVRLELEKEENLQGNCCDNDDDTNECCSSSNKCCKTSDTEDNACCENKDECTTCTVPTNDAELTDKQFDDEYPGQMKEIACDTKLLDLVYGLLQLDLANKLLSDLVVDETLNIPERNEKTFALIKEKWSNMNALEKDARSMQYEAAALVKPCQEAYSNWANWSVI